MERVDLTNPVGNAINPTGNDSLTPPSLKISLVFGERRIVSGQDDSPLRTRVQVPATNKIRVVSDESGSPFKVRVSFDDQDSNLRCVVSEPQTNSPHVLYPPVPYHFYEHVCPYIADASSSKLDQFRSKSCHTLAPKSVKKQYKVLKNVYSEAIEARLRLSRAVQEVKIVTKKGDVITVREKEFVVTSASGESISAFGVHEMKTLRSDRLCHRAFPIRGKDTLRFRGEELFQLIHHYNTSSLPMSFKDFCDLNRK